jgi:hypothetical protein
MTVDFCNWIVARVSPEIAVSLGVGIRAGRGVWLVTLSYFRGLASHGERADDLW